MDVGSWQQTAKQFIKDSLDGRTIEDSGSVLRIEYPERKMYVKVNVGGELSASAYFTDMPHKSEFEQDYMLYTHQHIDFIRQEFDEIETAKARAKIRDGNQRAYDIIKSTKIHYKEIFDDYYKNEIDKNIFKVKKFKGVARRATGKIPVNVSFSLYSPAGESVKCLDCYYNDEIFSFILTTNEFPKTSTHYSFGFFNQLDKTIRGGFMILAQKANFNGVGTLDGRSDVSPIYMEDLVGDIRVEEYDRVIEDGEKLSALVEYYEKLVANEKIKNEQDFQKELDAIMEDFKKAVTRKTHMLLEEAKKAEIDKIWHVKPDPFAPPPKPFDEQFEDAIQLDIDNMKKRLKDLFNKMKDKKNPSELILKEISELWHGKFREEMITLEAGSDNQKIAVSEFNDIVLPRNFTSFGDENNNYLIGAVKAIIDDSDKMTEKMKEKNVEPVLVDIHNTNSWFVTDFYKYLPRYDVKKYPTGKLLNYQQTGGWCTTPMVVDFSAEPLVTSITELTDVGVGVHYAGFSEGYTKTYKVPDYYDDVFKDFGSYRMSGKCNRNINQAFPSTELLPLMYYIRRFPSYKEDYSKIGTTNDINFISMYNMTSLSVITPNEKTNNNCYYGCYSLGKRKNPLTRNQKWCSTKIKYDGVSHIDEPIKVDSVYSFPNNFGLSYTIGEEIM